MEALLSPASDRGRMQPPSSGELIKTYIQHAEARRTASRSVAQWLSGSVRQSFAHGLTL